MKYQGDGYSRLVRMNAEKLTSYLRKRMLPQKYSIRGVKDTCNT
jgi:hypothetical protein